MATGQQRCAECDVALETSSKRKFCSDLCKNMHNIQRFINQVQRWTFTISEAAKATGLSESTIRNRARAQGVQLFNLDRRARIRRSDAMRLLRY